MKILNGNRSNRTKIQSEFLEDPRLSFAAKGLFSYLLANRLNDFNTSDLCRASQNGRDGTLNVIKELMRYGYIQREQLKNSEGQFCGIQYYIYPDARSVEI